jgi:TonB family protein
VEEAQSGCENPCHPLKSVGSNVDHRERLRYHSGVRSIGRFEGAGAAIVLLASSLCHGQGIKETSVPLENALNQALGRSSLTGANAVPFHLKVHLIESTNPPSPYRAEIEEYWVSAQQWRRSIDSPDFKQTLIVNGDQVSEQDTGDYYPLWLKGFINGIFDPVPNADQWNKLDAKITQITLPNGLRSEACARAKFKIGSDTVKNDAFGNVCFDSQGQLKFFGSPGYSMEFHDYQRFGKKLMIARRYQDDPEPGTKLVANVVLLEELKKPDASLFAVTQPTLPELRIESIEVSQTAIEQAAQGQPPVAWPPVQSGNTTGLLSMYISVDRDGRVREAYPLNSDNAGLQDAARDQLLKWKLKPMAAEGRPVQAQAALSFRFDTTLVSQSAQPAGGAVAGPVPQKATPEPAPGVKRGLVKGFLVSQSQPWYPDEAKEKHIQGKVVLSLLIDTDGTTSDIEVLSSPDQALTDSAIAAVKQWRYKPYELNGVPVSIRSEVEVNFQLP